jgi:electron transfer flavoprotein alpha subunit
VLVRSKSFDPEPSGGSANVVPVNVEIPDDTKKAKRVERHEETASGPKLEEAPVVISGGRGLQEAKNFELLDQLSEALGGAAVGATRAVVDAGWVPYAYQVGQTGVTVKPSIYLAFGISGATQHMVGMKGAKKIIAVNKDEDAPIFQIADLGIVGDALKILPQLIEEVKALRGHAKVSRVTSSLAPRPIPPRSCWWIGRAITTGGPWKSPRTRSPSASGSASPSTTLRSSATPSG